jgi:DNA-binding XRE family transcriptional regulator
VSPGTDAAPSRPAAPVPAPARAGAFGAKRWTITTVEGLAVTGHLPDWAVEDPSRSGVPLDDLPFVLRDILHWTVVAGLPLAPVRAGGPDDPPGANGTDNGGTGEGVFLSTIESRPYPERPGHLHRPVPNAGFQITDRCWIADLGPDGLARLAAQLRAQADRLDHEVRPALIAARQDWTAHHRAAGSVRRAPASTAQVPRTRTRTTKLRQEPAAVTWAREKAGLTKRALADRVGISEQLMGEIESGWRSATPVNLAKIAAVLNCPLVVVERKVHTGRPNQSQPPPVRHRSIEFPTT